MHLLPALPLHPVGTRVAVSRVCDGLTMAESAGAIEVATITMSGNTGMATDASASPVRIEAWEARFLTALTSSNVGGLAPGESAAPFMRVVYLISDIPAMAGRDPTLPNYISISDVHLESSDAARQLPRRGPGRLEMVAVLRRDDASDVFQPRANRSIGLGSTLGMQWVGRSWGKMRADAPPMCCASPAGGNDASGM